jgi:hypothetical protein
MKKNVTAILCISLCILFLSGCGIISRSISALRRAARDTPMPVETYDWYSSSPAETVENIETAQPPETAAPEPSETAPLLSGNRSDIPSEELLQHFREAVFGGGGKVALKWADPIVISMSGSYDQQDESQATDIYDMLNEYQDNGFPGAIFAQAAGADAEVNVEIRFVTADTLASAEPNWSGKSPCYAHYWYDDNDEIYKGVIYIVPDMETSRANRNCDLTWGIFYTLGFIYDSSMYYDSLFYPDYYGDALGSSFKVPAWADWYLVSMLYSKAVKPGMTYEQAAAALTN